MQFRINTPKYAFISFTTHERYIFAFGGGYDIKLDKKETSYMANSNPSSYNFGANINALYGNIYPNRFTPKDGLFIKWGKIIIKNKNYEDWRLGLSPIPNLSFLFHSLNIIFISLFFY